MTDIIRLTETLVKKGLAYQVDGDVYFEVAKYPEYGRLSKRRLDDLQAGARVEVDERKRHPMDFALWKSSKPGEPSWESPWGPGDQAGISNVLPCRCAIWARPSTFMAAGWI